MGCGERVSMWPVVENCLRRTPHSRCTSHSYTFQRAFAAARAANRPPPRTPAAPPRAPALPFPRHTASSRSANASKRSPAGNSRRVCQAGLDTIREGTLCQSHASMQNQLYRHEYSRGMRHRAGILWNIGGAFGSMILKVPLSQSNSSSYPLHVLTVVRRVCRCPQAPFSAPLRVPGGGASRYPGFILVLFP